MQTRSYVGLFTMGEVANVGHPKYSERVGLLQSIFGF